MSPVDGRAAYASLNKPTTPIGIGGSILIPTGTDLSTARASLEHHAHIEIRPGIFKALVVNAGEALPSKLSHDMLLVFHGISKPGELKSTVFSGRPVGGAKITIDYSRIGDQRITPIPTIIGPREWEGIAKAMQALKLISAGQYNFDSK